jgi:hypothetical protein
MRISKPESKCDKCKRLKLPGSNGMAEAHQQQKSDPVEQECWDEKKTDY